MHGIVTLHSGETAGARTRASAIDDNAQSAATAVTVRIKFLAPGNGVSDGRTGKVRIATMVEAAWLKAFRGSDAVCFIVTGGDNEAQM